MALPLNLPGTPGLGKITLSPRSKVGVTRGEFNGKQEIFDWSSNWWEAAVQVPPMSQANAGAWEAFMLACDGMLVPFLLGDTSRRNPLGAAAAVSSGPIIAGPNQLAGGKTLAMAGWPASTANLLLAGDYIQIRDNLIKPDPTDLTAWLPSFSSAPTMTVFADSIGNVAKLQFPAVTLGNFSDWYQIPLSVGIDPASQTLTFSILLRGDAAQTIALIIADNATFEFRSLINVTTSWVRYTVSGTALANSRPNIQVLLRNDGRTLAQSAQTIYAGDAYLAASSWPRLHKVAMDPITGATAFGSDSSGNLTVPIFPRLRKSPCDQDPVFWKNCKGTFRLADNQPSWDIGIDRHYGFAFKAMEAI